MRAKADSVGTFEKVGECLYRYTTNGKYYARIQVNCKEVRRSLGTTDRPTARRKLADLQRDLEKTRARLYVLPDRVVRSAVAGVSVGDCAGAETAVAQRQIKIRERRIPPSYKFSADGSNFLGHKRVVLFTTHAGGVAP